MPDTSRAEAIAHIINDVLLKEEGRPAPYVYKDGRVETSGGQISGGMDRPVTTVVTVDERSVTLSVQLAGRKGYETDILSEFADDSAIQKYAIHALLTIYERNGWELVTSPERHEYFILNSATSAWLDEKFLSVEAAEARMKELRLKGYISDEKMSVSLYRDFSN